MLTNKDDLEKLGIKKTPKIGRTFTEAKPNPLEESSISRTFLWHVECLTESQNRPGHLQVVAQHWGQSGTTDYSCKTHRAARHDSLPKAWCEKADISWVFWSEEVGKAWDWSSWELGCLLGDTLIQMRSRALITPVSEELNINEHWDGCLACQVKEPCYLCTNPALKWRLC